VQRLAREFLVAEDQRSIARVLEQVSTFPANATFDVVGEAVLTEAEAEHYVQRNLRLLDWLAAASGAPPAISVKLSALTARFDPIDARGARRRALTRLDRLLVRAAELGAAITGGAAVALLSPSGLSSLAPLPATLLLLPPSIFMGGTLPAVTRYVMREGAGMLTSVATLYGVNTLGASLGAGLSGFFLFEALGIDRLAG
jgi:hypothetical protein